jgi:tetratricopeptide (TPR) repeat protein
MQNSILLSSLLLLTCGVALGQTSSTVAAPLAPAAADLYAAEPIVIERLDHVYVYAADGTGSETTTVVVRVQSDAMVRQFGVVNISFAGASQRVEIGYVRVRKADGSVAETPVSQAIEMPSPVTTAAPFYSDLKQMQIPVRNLRVGDRLEWKATIVRTKAEATGAEATGAEATGEFWGQDNFVSDSVVLSETLELHVPKDTMVKVSSPKHPAVEAAGAVVGSERVFRWESSQKKPMVGKDAEAEKERKKKTILTADEELDGTEGKLPDVAWTTFKSWEAVGAWYRGLEADRIVPDAAVKGKVAELIAGKTTDEAKVRAVYGYVATQIRYIRVAFGVGRYQPHLASEVLENQYGDCKDKHTLLAAMLKVLGLDPDAVLIGAGVRFDEAVPSPGSFNHLITTVKVDGQPVWLDATAEVAPYRMLMYGLRDKKALVIAESEAARVEQTPAKLPFDSYVKMDAVGTLGTDGVSTSRLTMTFRGDDELVLRGALRQMSAADYGNFVERLSHGMGYAGTTSNVEISKLEDTSGPLTISYDYKRDRTAGGGGADWSRHQIIPQVMPEELPIVDEKEPPVSSIRLGVPQVRSSTSAMKLPDGWTAVLPEAVHQKSAWVTYDETYRFEKGTVYADRKIEVLAEKVPVAEWKAYKKWADSVDLGRESYISLTVTGDSKGVTGGPPPVLPKMMAEPTLDPLPTARSTKPSNSEAAEKVQAAYQAVQRRDWSAAQEDLDAARKLNSEQAWLWAGYGDLEAQRYQLPKAIDDYQREIVLHPETHEAYSQLARLQSMMNQRHEARATLEKWEKAQPESAEPVSALVTMLLEREDAAGADEVAEAAVARLPEGAKNADRMQLLLGEAQIRAGKKEAGKATLAAVLKSSEDSGVLNDAAYELADGGVALPEAETAARKAMVKLEAESQSWTLDEDEQLLRQRSGLIVSAWDTMGWTLFKEGKTREASDYIGAAFHRQQSADIGGHLGAIEESLGHKDAALKAYELALGAYPTFDMMGVRTVPGTKQKAIAERVKTLRKGGAKSAVADGGPDADVRGNPAAHKALQDMRTIQLGAAGGKNGTATYRMLLSAAAVERVEKSGDSAMDGGEERVKAAKFAGWFPSGSTAKLVVTGILNCHADVCELVVEPQ